MDNQTNEIRLGYKGFTHPMNKEEVVPAIQSFIKSCLDNLKSKPVFIVTRADLIEVLETINELTEPVGFYYNEYSLG